MNSSCWTYRCICIYVYKIHVWWWYKKKEGVNWGRGIRRNWREKIMGRIQTQRSPRKFSNTTTKTQFLRKIKQIVAWSLLHRSPSSLLIRACGVLPVSCFPIRLPVPCHFPLYCSLTTPALVMVILLFLVSVLLHDTYSHMKIWNYGPRMRKNVWFVCLCLDYFSQYIF